MLHNHVDYINDYLQTVLCLIIMIFPSAFSFDGENISFSIIDNYNWTSQVKIKEYNSVLTLYGNSRQPYSIKQLAGKQSLSLLKSNLQKCIRRKDEERAIRTALAIYSCNANELLRRLPVIFIEDCLPNPEAFIKLVWWMSAVSKGYIMSKPEIESMLGIISTMCDSDEYEVCNSQCLGSDAIDWSDNSFSPFFWALEIRRIYGGMTCDKQMFKYHQNLWFNRLKLDEEKWAKKLNDQIHYSVDLDSVDSISKNDILLESIDYHCFPWLIKKLKERYNIDENKIKQIIWLCRSRINFRKPIDCQTFIHCSPSIIDGYKQIKPELESLAKWILLKLELSN